MDKYREESSFRRLCSLALGRYFKIKSPKSGENSKNETDSNESQKHNKAELRNSGESNASHIKPLNLMAKLNVLDQAESGPGFKRLSVQIKSKDGSIRYRTFTFSPVDPLFDKKQAQFSGRHLATGLRVENTELSRKTLQAERASLVVDAARAGMSDKSWDSFCMHVWNLENRSKKRNPELSNAQITELFKQTRRLFQTKASCAFGAELRMRIATQILCMTERPQDITQGSFQTCNVTVIENRMFTLEPDNAARFIADIVMTGKFKTIDETTIYMSNEMLEPDSEALSADLDGTRNLCSMIFQRTAANVFWQRQKIGPDGMVVPKGSIAYQQYERSRVSYERLLDMSTFPPTELHDRKGKPAVSPDLRSEDIMEVMQQLSHHLPHLIIIKRGQFNFAERFRPGLLNTHSIEHFHEILTGLKNDQAFPVFVLFPRHILVVRDYDPANKEASVDNSYSSEFDFLGVDEGSNPRKQLQELYKQMSD